MKKLRLIVIAISVLLTSCSVLKTSSIKTFDIHDTGVVQTPVLVDLDVNEAKVTGTAEGDKDDLKQIKEDAILDALESSGADVLVEPRFKTVTHRGKTVVTVTGYPAVYKNFRPLTNDEILLYENGILQEAEGGKVVIHRE